MTGAEFTAWRQRLGLYRTDAAQLLDVSVSRLLDYERGSTRGSGRPAPIPRVVELACKYLEDVLTPPPIR